MAEQSNNAAAYLAERKYRLGGHPIRVVITRPKDAWTA
jgi:hypothetical protein